MWCRVIRGDIPPFPEKNVGIVELTSASSIFKNSDQLVGILSMLIPVTQMPVISISYGQFVTENFIEECSFQLCQGVCCK